MKGLSILGSTGSIGTNVLRVVDAFPGRFEVVGLAAGGNVEVLAGQFNPSNFFRTFCHLVHDTLHSYKLNPENVLGISIACMRHSYVFLDKDGKELYAGPNTHVRGVFYQDVVESVPLDLYQKTGQGPPLMFLPARLLWFKNERPEVFSKIKYALTSGDWLLYRLSGEYATEPSLASTTLLFDLEKKQWIPEIMESLDINDVMLPKIHQAGERIGELTEDAANQMGLSRETPVCPHSA